MKILTFLAAFFASSAMASEVVTLRCLCLAVDNSETTWSPGECRIEYDRFTRTYREVCEEGRDLKGRVRVVTPALRFQGNRKNFQAQAKIACQSFIEKNLAGDFDFNSISISNCTIEN